MIAVPWKSGAFRPPPSGLFFELTKKDTTGICHTNHALLSLGFPSISSLKHALHPTPYRRSASFKNQ